MEANESVELEIAVKVLQDSFAELSREHTRLREASAFLERRVRQLEQRSPEPASPRAAAEDAAVSDAQRDQNGAKAVKVEEPKNAPAKPGQIADSAAVDVAVEDEKAEEILGRHLDNECQGIEVNTSSWDACLLVGSPALGYWGSASTVLCILVNTTIQIIFVAIVYANLVDAEFAQEDLEGLIGWRLRVAHDDRFISPHGLSLASRVCGQDPTLELSNEQAAKVDLIRRYNPRLDPQLDTSQVFSRDWMRWYFDGSLMCLLAVACWVLTVWKEVGGVFDLIGAVAHLPTSSGIGVHVVSQNDSAEIVSAGRVSKCFMFFVTGLRFTIAMLLLSFGVLYVTYTSSIEDLLLNAVALECVLTVDELTFEALAPRRARQVVSRLAPLKLPPWRSRKPWLRAIDVKTTGLFTLLVTALVLVYQIPLMQHMTNLEMAHNAMCNGTTNFTVVADKFDMIHAKYTRPFDPDSEFISMITPQDLAIKEVASGASLEEWSYTLDPTSYGIVELSQFSTMNWLDTSTAIYGRRSGAGCHDAVDITSNPQMAYMKVYMEPMWPLMWRQRRVWLNYLTFWANGRQHSGPERTSCSDFAHFCGSVIVQAFCPKTCGCESLIGGTQAESTTSGCPAVCRDNVNLQERMTTTCVDAQHHNASDPKWQALMQRADSMGGPVGEAIRNQSCAGLIDGRYNWLCESPLWFTSSYTRTSYQATDPYVMKILTYLCPETCNCGGRAQGRAKQLMMGVVPAKESCPDSCTCPWTFPADPGQTISTCSVRYYYNNYTLNPINTSGRCCVLISQHAMLAERELVMGIGSVDQSFAHLLSMLCHTCYRSCLEDMWAMSVVEEANWTYPTAYSLAMTGSTVVTHSAYDFLCSQYVNSQPGR